MKEFLYHGSPTSGIKRLEQRMISKRSDQKKPRVYAVTTKAEAAIFGCPFHDGNSRIRWSGGKICLYLKGKSLMRKYPVSIYLLNKQIFKSVDESNIEWYSESSVPVLKEIRIKDALAYAKRNGAIISLDTV